MRKYVIAILIVSIIAIFYRYGRSIYIPVLNKMSDKETVHSIQEELTTDVLDRLRNDLNQIGLKTLPDSISILAFKEEEILEVWAQVDDNNRLLKSYPFSANSGMLGPKLKEGDKQIPEGLYKIEYLNPNSSYHLSLKVSYPNDFDQKKTIEDGRTDIGSDIFIHGRDVTVGCIPLGDKAIEELFIMAATAIENNIAVIISPRDFRLNNNFPTVTSVGWSEELYKSIKMRLEDYKN